MASVSTDLALDEVSNFACAQARRIDAGGACQLLSDDLEQRRISREAILEVREIIGYKSF